MGFAVIEPEAHFIEVGRRCFAFSLGCGAYEPDLA
jgi:hypothetical protein